MKRNLFLLFIFLTNLIFAQSYVWPTDSGKHLSSNLGEFRHNHFHMGLDIRTNARIGHRIYAVNDGYIYRMATNFGGYGKAIYLKTKDGKIALYGHLNRLTAQLESRLYKFQNTQQSYFVDKYFMKNEIPVKRGDVIGYSGNSGGSMGPHLHFEFRNANDQPLNPLKVGFLVSDNVQPKFLNLSIIPLAAGTNINDSPLPQNYIPINLSPGVFTLSDTISIDGKFGLATQVIDKIQNAVNSYQIDRIELLVDSLSVFSVSYDLLDFSEGKRISTVYGQPPNHPKSDNFQKLYRLESYPKLTIHKDNNTGVLNLTDGLHQIMINAWDAAQNKSTLHFYVKTSSVSKNVNYNIFNNIKSFSRYTKKSAVFKPKLIALEKGVIFQLQTEISDSTEIRAFIKYPDSIIIFPLKKIGINNYVTELLNASFFEGGEKCGFLIKAGSLQQYDFTFIPSAIAPSAEVKFYTSDSLGFAELSDAVYDSTLLWITKSVNTPQSNINLRKSHVYELHPSGIPFKKDISVTLNISENIDLSHCSFYSYNKKRSRWSFMSSVVDYTTHSITAKFDKAATFAILEDTKSPQIISTFPKDQQLYSQGTFKKIKIVLDDNLSGIDSSEKNLKTYLDGRRIWVAYQPFEKEISYVLRNPLYKGEHNLIVNLKDRSGNSTSKSIKFFIE